MSERGRYIVLEGGDGCGKDTQVENLRTWIEDDLEHEVAIVREPYGPVLGDVIKDLLTAKDPNPNFADLDSWQQALLVNAARRGTLKEVASHLDDGLWVLSSRNELSTIVYQGHMGDIEGWNNSEGVQQTFRTLNLIGTAVEGASPDLVVILDIDPEEARKRMSGKDLDVFERMSLEDRQKIRKSYLRESEIYRWNGPKVIDANKSEQEVFSDLKQVVGALALKGYNPPSDSQ